MTDCWYWALRAVKDRSCDSIWWQVYTAYLASPEWAERRRLVLERANQVCEKCGLERATQVDHLTYRRVGSEPLRDLRAICNTCHEQRHPHMIGDFGDRWERTG